jgi:uncharacterized protein
MDSIPYDKLAAICGKHHVRRLSLFGSAARGAATPQSDIDLMVEFESGQAPSLAGMSRLKEELSIIFGAAKLDLATASILRNPYRRKTILSDLRELYAA